MTRLAFAALILFACDPRDKPERERDWLMQRLAYLEALKSLVESACPCGVALLEAGEYLDQLSCHPCDGLLVPVTTAPIPELGRLQ